MSYALSMVVNSTWIDEDWVDVEEALGNVDVVFQPERETLFMLALYL